MNPMMADRSRRRANCPGQAAPVRTRAGMWLLGVGAALWTALAAVRAVQPVDLESIEEALRIARATLGSERAEFHARYRLFVATPPVDYVEVVTPFRRVVLAAQASLTRGERRFGQREALELLSRAPSQMDVYVELTFHPLNTYVGVPGFTVALVGPDRSRVPAQTMSRVPRVVPRLDGLPPALPGGSPAAPQQSAPLVGGTLVAAFDLQAIDPDGTYDLAIEEGDREIARARLMLRRLK